MREWDLDARGVQRTVVATIGDGSFQYSIQAIWTAAQHKLPIVYVVMRNGEYAIVNEGSDKVLDVADNRLQDNGANVQQYRWSGRDNQRWRIDPTGQGFYRIVNVASGKCLDVERKSDRDGANIHQWECNNDRTQEWRLSR